MTSVGRAHEPQLIERVLEAVYRWRTMLGIGLAASMTLAIVVTYWARSGPGADSLAGATADTVIAGPDTVLSPFNSESAGSNGSSPISSTPGEPVASSTQPTTATSGGATTAPVTSAVASGGPPTSEAESTTTVSQVVEESTSSTDVTLDPTSSTSNTSTPTTSEPATTSTTATTVVDTSPTSAGSTTQSTIDDPTRVEAETGTMLGQGRARSDHGGFSGTGFVGDIITQGSGVELEVDAAKAGATPFTVRYAAGDVAGKEGPRTLTVLVNGTTAISASMALTPTWSDWDFIVGELTLDLGLNTITVIWSDGDTGWVNIDYIQIN